jgi:hypothetical protein
VASKHVQEGQKDRCRMCGEFIWWTRKKHIEQRKVWNSKEQKHEYQPIERWEVRWWHKREGELEQKCVPEHVEAYKRISQNYHSEATRPYYNPYAIPTSFCPEHTESGYSYQNSTCHRRVKDAALGMCGIHARPIREREARDRRQAEIQRQKEFEVKGIKGLIAELEKLGVKGATIHYKIVPTYKSYPTHTSEITGKVVVDPEQLIDLLTEERFD